MTVRVLPDHIDKHVRKVSDSRIATIASFGYETYVSTRDILSVIWKTKSVATASFLNDVSRTIALVVSDYVELNRVIRFVERRMPLVGVAGAPFALYGVVKNGLNLANNDALTESGVLFGQYLGWLANTMIGALKIARDHTTFEISTKVWFNAAINPLANLAIVSYGITFIAHVYGLHENYELLDSYKNIPKMSVKRLEEAFHIDGNFIKGRIQGARKVTIDALKGRVQSKITNHKLNMLAISVLGIGLAVQLMTGITLAAGAISITGSMISLGAIVYDLYEELNMERSLQSHHNEYKKYSIGIGLVSLVLIPGFVLSKAMPK